MTAKKEAIMNFTPGGKDGQSQHNAAQSNQGPISI
jgi:hypothetical protein